MVDQLNVAEDVCKAFAAVTNKKLRWAIAKVNGANVELVETAERDSTIEACQAVLGDEPVYIVIDFEADKPDGSKLLKTCFIPYAPDSCTSMQAKFALQNYKACVKSKSSAQKEFQINDKADFTLAEFRSQFNLD